MTPLKLLYVDDEDDIREIAALAFGLDPQIEVKTESSGAGAIQIATEWRPDVILLDVMMPSMDGPTTLLRLREIDATAHVPVFFITARAQSKELEFFMSLGVKGVIIKPFDPMSLAAEVRQRIAA